MFKYLPRYSLGMKNKVKVTQCDRLCLGENKVENIIQPKKIMRFSNSGAYISVTGDYAGHMAYIIVLKRGIKK